MKKKVTFKLIYFLFLLCVGILMIFIGIYNGGDNSDYIKGFGTGMSLVSVCMLLRLYLKSRNPEKLKEMEISEKDERNKTIINYSYAITFRITILAQAIASIFFAIGKQTLISEVLGFIVGVQLIILLITAIFISKKI